jgi:hypothetical protein
MGSHKAFDANRIAQSLAILDAWRASALPLRAFATLNDHKYDQLRAWLRHEPRWRGQPQPKIAPPPSSHSGAFQRMGITSPEMPHQYSLGAIRIECTSQEGKRSASIHFPPVQDSITLSAQWLVAYLSA